ncbi:MAG: GMC family oxidoreductase [Deltaproteobacteria bacterium]|nr:GMC family oxidoreductase [Deltaproteobacteria bacterium]
MSGSQDYDVIVVGSGFGGSSAAESLARGGLKVAILERGTWWGAFTGHRPYPETLPQIIAALAGLNLSGFGRSLNIPLSRRGLLEVSLHGGTIVVNSSCVGGNSPVSGEYLARPEPQFFDALPPELTAAELDPHYQRIERALEVAPGPQDEGKLALLTALADKQQWKIRPTPQAIRWKSDDEASQPPCTNCNRCMFSCNVGAKMSMDQTLIPSAIKAGAVLRDMCEVQTVEPVTGGYEVRVHDGPQGRTGDLRAPRVVLAAGTLNTLKILLRSTVVGGLGTIPGLGQHFSMTGDHLALYRVSRDIEPEKITGHIMHTEIRVPGSGNEFDQLILCGTTPIVPGSWLMRRLQGRRTLGMLGFGPDSMDGQVSWKGRGIVVRHDPQSVVRRIQVSMDRIAQTHGWNKPVRQAGPEQRVRSWLSFHPLGGCRMAADASRGVVDFRGEVFGHPGLYVADASVFPTVTIAGPQLSVSALASWIAERIIKDAV